MHKDALVLERNQRFTRKEPYMSLTLTVLLVLLIKIGVSELEINTRASPFAMCLPCGAKWLKYAGDVTYLTAYGWTYTSYDPCL